MLFDSIREKKHQFNKMFFHELNKKYADEKLWHPSSLIQVWFSDGENAMQMATSDLQKHARLTVLTLPYKH